LERVGELNGVTFYNDSKATNLASAKAALDSFEGGVFLILGGRSKGGDFEELRSHVKRNVKRVLAIGEAKKRIALALGDLVPVDSCRSLREAVRAAFRHAISGDTVLLSPACASFDMFADYEERGERFREEVEKLAKRDRKGKSRTTRDEGKEED
jgi:UDP-N-acetylmuramoylalanine--D-glutamate ligase